MRRSNASSSSSDVHVSPRIVSLVPSSTETLLSLGAPVTACTRFCEQPGIPHVGGTKNPDIERIIELAPDFVVMDREENRREDADTLAAAGIELFVSDVTTVDAAEQVVIDLADRAGRPRPDSAVPPSTASAGATAFVPIWRRPWMSINRSTYAADLLARLGIVLVTDERTRPLSHRRPRRRRRPASDSRARAERAVRVPRRAPRRVARCLRCGRAGRCASTDATCSGGAAGPRAPWPASAPNSPRSSRDLLRCA